MTEVVTVRFGEDKISIPSYFVRDWMLKNGYVPDYAIKLGVVDIDRDLLGDPYEIWAQVSDGDWSWGWRRQAEP